MRGINMKQLLAVLAFGLLLFTGSAHAAGSSDTPAETDLAEMMAARNHIKAERYKDAIPQLQKVIAQQPQNTDAWNLLAYSQRKMDDLTASLENYKKALSIDPSHKDAHEYLGELYLRMGDLAKAEKQLKRLDNLCFFGCDQLDELKSAIAAYKKN
jgi:Flp pilus assembly protein TadD